MTKQTKLDIKAPPLTGAQRQATSIQALRERATLGDAARNQVIEFESLLLKLAWLQDPIATELVAMADMQGLPGIIRFMHKKRQSLESLRAREDAAADVDPFADEVDARQERLDDPDSALVATVKTKRRATVLPSKGRAKPVTDGNG